MSTIIIEVRGGLVQQIIHDGMDAPEIIIVDRDIEGADKSSIVNISHNDQAYIIEAEPEYDPETVFDYKEAILEHNLNTKL